MLGFAFCGSFCTMGEAIKSLERLCAEGYQVQPIMSECAYSTDTRFHKAQEFRERVESITGRSIIHTVASAEPLGPRTPLDALVIAPCTGNTLAKMALGITDTAVTMAAKAHLRSDRLTVIALASNDALSQNLQNISRMLTRRSLYFVPMRQDDPEGKPHSLVAAMDQIVPTLHRAMKGEQPRPIFI
jgi:dipicolinate synthase subunit B